MRWRRLLTWLVLCVGAYFAAGVAAWVAAAIAAFVTHAVNPACTPCYEVLNPAYYGGFAVTMLILVIVAWRITMGRRT